MASCDFRNEGCGTPIARLKGPVGCTRVWRSSGAQLPWPSPGPFCWQPWCFAFAALATKNTAPPISTRVLLDQFFPRLRRLMRSASRVRLLRRVPHSPPRPCGIGSDAEGDFNPSRNRHWSRRRGRLFRAKSAIRVFRGVESGVSPVHALTGAHGGCADARARSRARSRAAYPSTCRHISAQHWLDACACFSLRAGPFQRVMHGALSRTSERRLIVGRRVNGRSVWDKGCCELVAWRAVRRCCHRATALLSSPTRPGSQGPSRRTERAWVDAR